MKSKKISQMYKAAGKIVFSMVFLSVFFTSCRNKKDESYGETQKVVLVSDMSEQIANRLDSIVYLYMDIIKNKKSFVVQTEYYNFEEKPLSSGYYLLANENYLYLGESFCSRNDTVVYDTITYFPYCSLLLHDTVYYDINNGIEWLEGGSGYTIYARELDSNKKEYKGTFFKNPMVIFEDSIKWILDCNNRIEKIQIGESIILRKKSEETLLDYPYEKPPRHSVDILMPPKQVNHAVVNND